MERKHSIGEEDLSDLSDTEEKPSLLRKKSDAKEHAPKLSLDISACYEQHGLLRPSSPMRMGTLRKTDSAFEIHKPQPKVASTRKVAHAVGDAAAESVVKAAPANAYKKSSAEDEPEEYSEDVTNSY